jgi:hypothetical protein
MKTARTLHHEAMNKLRDAETASEKQNYSLYNKLLVEALNLESEAAYLLRDKYEAEPTRSVLFRGAASLALRCSQFKKAEQLVLTALTGNVPAEIKSELLDAFANALSGNSLSLPLIADLYGGQQYTATLREKSVSLKVAPKGKSTGTAVRIDHAINVMRNVRASYINYNIANYRRSFGQQILSQKHEKLIRQSISDELLIADLKQASFGFSVSADTIMSPGITAEIATWKEKTFETFKSEVIEVDYNSIDIATGLADKYTPEELRGVYGPIASMLQESNGYTVSITNSGFTEIKKILKPINKSIRSIVVPKIAPTESDLKLYQAVGLGTADTGLQKSNIIDKEEINYMQFNRTVNNIAAGKSILYLKEDYTFTIEYNLGVWSIDSDDLGFRVESGTHKDILIKYEEYMIELYKELYSIEYENLSLDAKRVRDRFEELIGMVSID